MTCSLKDVCFGALFYWAEDFCLLQENVEDTKGLTTSRKPKKDRQYTSKRKGTNGKIMFYKTLNREIKIEQHEHH
jgi:hypothetical protein